MRSKMLATVAFCSISLLWYNEEKGIYQVGWRKMKEDLSSNWKIGEDRRKIKTVYLLSPVPRSIAAAAAFFTAESQVASQAWQRIWLSDYEQRKHSELCSRLVSSFPLQQVLEEGKAGNSQLCTFTQLRLSNVRNNACCDCLANSTINPDDSVGQLVLEEWWILTLKLTSITKLFTYQSEQITYYLWRPQATVKYLQKAKDTLKRPIQKQSLEKIKKKEKSLYMYIHRNK